jgi:hypothetical protein
MPVEEAAAAWTGDRKFSVSCDLGVCYPSLLAMMNQDDFHLSMSVRVVIFLTYTNILTTILYIIGICIVYA